MRVNSLYNYGIYSQNKSIKQTGSVSAPLGNFGISFKGNAGADTVNLYTSKGLAKLKDFSKEEYETLSQEEIKVLREEYEDLTLRDNKKHYPILEKMHDKTAESIKKTLDKKYGKNTYVVIPIGRSLSSIGKVLGYKIGEENVINIPMSNAGQYFVERCMKQFEANRDIDILRKFLAEQGLTKEKIKDSGKTYVIMDYCCSGISLNGAKALLTRPDVLGNEHIETMDVAKCVKDKEQARILSAQLFRCAYKDFSFVFEAHSIPDMPRALLRPNVANSDTKLFWFKLLDNEMTKVPEPKPHNFIMSFFQKVKNIIKNK